MSYILSKKTLAFSLALVLLLTGFATAGVIVTGQATYGIGNPDCEFDKHDTVGLYSPDKQTCYMSRNIGQAPPHNYTVFCDGDAGYYYLKFYTYTTGYRCWVYIYLNSGTNEIDHDMCALCNEL